MEIRDRKTQKCKRQSQEKTKKQKGIHRHTDTGWTQSQGDRGRAEKGDRRNRNGMRKTEQRKRRKT